MPLRNQGICGEVTRVDFNVDRRKALFLFLFYRFGGVLKPGSSLLVDLVGS